MSAATPLYRYQSTEKDPLESEELARDFRSRQDLESYLHSLFDGVTADHPDRPHYGVSAPIPGGRDKPSTD